MTYYGDKGGWAYPEINRVRLVSGEDYAKGARPGQRATLRNDDEPSNYGRRATWSARGRADLTSKNAFGLVSRSEFLFPEAFKPVDTKFWQPLSNEEHAALFARQAAANVKATFQDRDAMPIAATSADESYLEASTRRHLSMKHRKPTNYDERKREEERKRKAPLQRRYTPAEILYRSSTQIISNGPIETPILVQGLPMYAQTATGAAPERIKPGRRRKLSRRVLEIEPTPVPQTELPTFNPNSAPKMRTGARFSNTFGLTSRSEMLFPEAYRELSTVYWQALSSDDRAKVMNVQARAMEKVGYERGTEKIFIEEIFEEDSYDYLKRRGARNDDTRPGATLSVEFVVTLVIVLAIVVFVAVAGWQFFDEAGIGQGKLRSAPQFEGD